MSKNTQQKSRRDFIKKAGYAAPAVLTLSAAPALAGVGSGTTSSKGNNGIGQEKRGFFDGPPPGLAKKSNQDFNDNGNFAPRGKSGAKAGGRPE
jgi:hypothetical protein